MNATIQVCVRYYNVLRDMAGHSEEMRAIPAGTSLRTLLRDGVARDHPAIGDILFPQAGRISPYTRIFWNGTVAGEHDLDRCLQDGDEIRVFPAIGGG